MCLEIIIHMYMYCVCVFPGYWMTLFKIAEPNELPSIECSVSQKSCYRWSPLKKVFEKWLYDLYVGKITTIPEPESSIRLVKQDQNRSQIFSGASKNSFWRWPACCPVCGHAIKTWEAKAGRASQSYWVIGHTYFNHLVLHSKIWKINVISHFIPHCSFHFSFHFSFSFLTSFRSFRAGFF